MESNNKPKRAATKKSTHKHTAKKNKAPKKQKKNSGCLLTIIILIIIAAIASIAGYFILNGANEDVLIKIPRKATIQNVEDSVAKYLGSDYASMVKSIIRTQHTDWNKRNGAYKISKGMNPARAARILTHGGQSGVKLTIRHLRTKDQLAEFLAARLDMTEKEFLQAFNDADVQATYKLKPEEMIVLFMEDTYEVYWSTSPEALIEKMASYYNKFWNENRRKKATELGLTPQEMMTLSSIVDEESSKQDEKAIIGRLYINRLNKGMRLQADPTAKFASGNFALKRITKEHTSKNSPYNTYRVNGLPPGPIGTTSRLTIDAILDSEPTDYIYMCAKEDFSGYHNFAVTYAEHQANARRYQKALDQRGIK